VRAGHHAMSLDMPPSCSIDSMRSAYFKLRIF
jgi:hypothetical protein